MAMEGGCLDAMAGLMINGSFRGKEFDLRLGLHAIAFRQGVFCNTYYVVELDQYSSKLLYDTIVVTSKRYTTLD